MADNKTFMNQHSSLKHFCLFVGYPKSGHSLIGSLLDAHPQMIIAHEQNVLRCISLGFNHELIFSFLLKNSLYFAQQGRKWRTYTYQVPNQWQGKFTDLQVIGDKKGGQTSKQLSEAPALLAELKSKIPLTCKFVHVIRNPFDSISSNSKNKNYSLDQYILRFLSKYDTVAKLKRQVNSDNIIDIHHEEFIQAPRLWLTRLCDFFQLTAPADYLEDCSTIVKPTPHKSRFEVHWSYSQIKQVEREIRRHPFLETYSYDS